MNIDLPALRRSMQSHPASDALRLAVLNIAYEANEHPIYSIMAERRRFAECIEDGKVAVVWSGMDCDGVRYSNEVTVYAAGDAKAAIEKELDYADGPIGYYFERPSIALSLQYESRDLGMEAFEDGHPHVLYG